MYQELGYCKDKKVSRGPFRLPSAHSGPFPMLNLLDMTHYYCMLIIGDAV